MRKYREPPKHTTIMTVPYEVDEDETDVEISYTYEPGDPGVYSGPLEHCYPGTGPEIEIDDVMHVVKRKAHRWVRTGETRSFDALPGDVQEKWTEQVEQEHESDLAEARAEARACRRCRGRDCEKCPL